MANAKDRIEDAKPYVKRAIQDEELPEETRNELEFILADTIEDVFAVAFSSPGRSRPHATPASERQAAAPV